MLYDWSIKGLERDLKTIRDNYQSRNIEEYERLEERHTRYLLQNKGQEDNKRLIFWNVML